MRSDAYRALLRGEQRYDVIVSEPSNPWVTGVEMLYSREFLEAARSRLRPGGVYVQWYHQYETDRTSVELVLRTYASVFDEIAVWYGAGPDLLILGFPDEARGLELQRVEARTRAPDIAAGLARSGVDSVPSLLAHELVPAGVVHALALQGPIHTLLHPILSDRAGRAFFQGLAGALPFTGFGRPAEVGTRNSLLQRYKDRSGGVLSEADYAALAGATCALRTDRCAAVLADWGLHHPGSPALARATAEGPANDAFGGPVGSRTVTELRALLLRGGPPLPAEIDPKLGQQATDAFERFYQYGLDFDGARLLALWERCRAPAQACEEGRTKAQALLQRGAP